MSVPLTFDMNVGYVEAEDVYITYTEYYDDGTIYGRRDVYLNGEAVKGLGKSVKGLVELGCMVPEEYMPAVSGSLVRVEYEIDKTREVIKSVIAKLEKMVAELKEII